MPARSLRCVAQDNDPGLFACLMLYSPSKVTIPLLFLASGKNDDQHPLEGRAIPASTILRNLLFAAAKCSGANLRDLHTTGPGIVWYNTASYAVLHSAVLPVSLSPSIELAIRDTVLHRKQCLGEDKLVIRSMKREFCKFTKKP